MRRAGQLFCAPGITSPMGTGASINDPLFWVM
jgi:hypothetical protein